MKPEEMARIVNEHLAAEDAGDPAAAVSMYTDDVIHDVVGYPTGPVAGPAAAETFYDWLVANITVGTMPVNDAWYGDNFCVMEHQWQGRVQGEFLGVPGRGRSVNARMLHVWEFKNDRISREIVWVDAATLLAQLMAESAPDATTTAN